MFDIIGKRRWFYFFSRAHHDPGPHLHPADAVHGRPRPAVLDRLHRRHRLGDPLRGSDRHAGRGRGGLRRSRASRRSPSRDQRRLHRDPDRADRPRGAAAPSADRVGRPSRVRPAAPRPARIPGRASASPSRLAPSPTASPSPSRRRRRGVARVARRRRRATPSCPTDGQLGEMVTALEAEFGPIDEQAQLTTIGPVVSSDLVSRRSS